jgi:hypothetical protein
MSEMLSSDKSIYRILMNSALGLYAFVGRNGWEGYDPYDALNSKLTSFIGKNSKWLRILITQFNKSFPVNLRSILGIKRGINPKGMGLFASAFLRLYKSTNDVRFLKEAGVCLDFLKSKSLREGYYNHCWSGLYFEYQALKDRATPRIPSVITTFRCAFAFLEDYEMRGADESLEIARSAADFVVENLYVNGDDKAFFKYRPGDELDSQTYNASTHGVALLCNISKYIEDNKILEIGKKVMDYVISKQKSNGAWYYSETNGKEKMQVDFHQGFILDDLYDYIKYMKPSDDKYMKALLKGAEFYKNEQFLPDGRAKWRWPRVYPIDIHNQAQGIITFSKLSEIKPEYLDFAKTIAKWTIENMQDATGYFYYQKWPFFTNKIPYMRWGQAWMMLALSSLLEKCENS